MKEEEKDREILKRQLVDGASEMTKDTHVDHNTDFLQGRSNPIGVRSDSEDMSQASVADNEVEKFTHEEFPKKKELEEPNLESLERGPDYIPNPDSAEER